MNVEPRRALYEDAVEPTGTTEPIAIGGAIMGVAAAATAVCMAFGVPITEAQWAVILTLLSTLIALVTVLQRSKVIPLSKIKKVVK